KPLALAVTFAMATSFVLSRTFVPMMCAKFLPDEHHRTAGHATPSGNGDSHGGPHTVVQPTTRFGRIHQRIEYFLEGLTHRYTGLLGKALRHRFLVLGVVLALFIGSLALTSGIGREFFPQVDAGQITLYVRTPSSTRLDAAEGRLAQVEQCLLDNIP